MLHTRRFSSALGLTIVSLAWSTHAQTPATSLFKGGTDLVQVDVSVLDGKRQPVRGLTAADFTLLEDGQPREIQAFTEIYLPDRVRTEAAPWVREVPSDVASNQTTAQEGRLVIIVLERTIPVGAPTITAKRTAAAIVEQLGPGDLAAIVSTGGGATHNCAYKIDQLKILEIRAKARQALGSQFDIRKFHNVVLQTGNVSLAVLERVIDGWIASQKPAR